MKLHKNNSLLQSERDTILIMHFSGGFFSSSGHTHANNVVYGLSYTYRQKFNFYPNQTELGSLKNPGNIQSINEWLLSMARRAQHVVSNSLVTMLTRLTTAWMRRCSMLTAGCTAASRYRQISWYVQQQLPDTGRFHGMYSSSFQIPADFMVCTAAASRYRQISWYVQQQLPYTGRLHGMYSSSFQIPADFMVCTAAASRYRQTSWYVQQQLPDTSRFHGMYRSFQIPADFMVCA